MITVYGDYKIHTDSKNDLRTLYLNYCFSKSCIFSLPKNFSVQKRMPSEKYYIYATFVKKIILIYTIYCDKLT